MDNKHRTNIHLAYFVTVFLFVCNSITIAEQIRINTVTEHSQMHPAVAANGNLVAVVWQSDANYFYEIMCAVSDDGGETFSAEMRVAGTPEQIHRDPDVAWGENGELHVVWQAVTDNRDYDILISTASDLGKTFSPPARVNSHKDGNQQFPSIGVSWDGTIFISWQDNSRNPSYLDIYMTMSSDSGITFSDRILLSQGDNVSMWPDVAPGGESAVFTWESAGNIHVPLTNDILYQEQITYYSPDLPEKTEFMYPRASLSSSGLHIASVGKRVIERPPDDDMYRHPGIDHDVYYSFIPAAYKDTEFSTPIKISKEVLGNQLRPDVVNIGEKAVVTWFDGRETGDYDIYIASGGTEGFGNEKRVNTTIGSDSRNPRIAVVEDNLVIVWQDDAEGNYDIYLSKIAASDLR